MIGEWIRFGLAALCVLAGCFALLTAMVRELAAGLLEQADRPGETADKAFLASFFAYGVTGMVTAWVQDGMKEPPEQAAARWQALLADLGLV